MFTRLIFIHRNWFFPRLYFGSNGSCCLKFLHSLDMTKTR